MGRSAAELARLFAQPRVAALPDPSYTHHSNASTPSPTPHRSNETHAVAARKQEQMDKLRKALGLREDIKWGEAFDPEAQARRKEEQKKVRARRES